MTRQTNFDRRWARHGGAEVARSLTTAVPAAIARAAFPIPGVAGGY
jgi:hypothetical protein